MESRKLIKFGGNSYVVSIPKSWISQNGLKKGDLLFIEEHANRLMVNTHDQHVKEIKTAVVGIDNKPLNYIRTELTTYYIRAYDVIEIRGESVEGRASKIKDLLKTFAGMELIEETAKKIVVKDLMDIREISVKTLIRRIDIIIRAMMDDTMTCFHEDHYESIYQRDRDVNRLVFLLKRVIRQAAQKRSIAIELGVTKIDILKSEIVVGYLESIGDCTKRIARAAVGKRIEKLCVKELQAIFKTYQRAYQTVMKSYHSSNIELAYEIELGSKKRLDLCEKFEQKHSVPMITYNLKSMTSEIKHIARAIMNLHVKRG